MTVEAARIAKPAPVMPSVSSVPSVSWENIGCVKVRSSMENASLRCAQRSKYQPMLTIRNVRSTRKT